MKGQAQYAIIAVIAIAAAIGVYFLSSNYQISIPTQTQTTTTITSSTSPTPTQPLTTTTTSSPGFPPQASITTTTTTQQPGIPPGEIGVILKQFTVEADDDGFYPMDTIYTDICYQTYVVNPTDHLLLFSEVMNIFPSK